MLSAVKHLKSLADNEIFRCAQDDTFSKPSSGISSKSEIRNKSKIENPKIQNEFLWPYVWNIGNFWVLSLFQISCFLSFWCGSKRRKRPRELPLFLRSVFAIIRPSRAPAGFPGIRPAAVFTIGSRTNVARQGRSRKHPSAARLRAALAHRNFRLFVVGQGISVVGTWMQQIATIWLVYRLSNSSFLLGLSDFVAQIPAALVLPLAGVLTDRWNRHRTVVATQVLAMFQAFVLMRYAQRGHYRLASHAAGFAARDW